MTEGLDVSLCNSKGGDPGGTLTEASQGETIGHPRGHPRSWTGGVE